MPDVTAYWMGNHLSNLYGGYDTAGRYTVNNDYPFDGLLTENNAKIVATLPASYPNEKSLAYLSQITGIIGKKCKAKISYNNVEEILEGTEIQADSGYVLFAARNNTSYSNSGTVVITVVTQKQSYGNYIVSYVQKGGGSQSTMVTGSVNILQVWFE